jgi:nitrite reductase/ring-hydroxylating ferredoxin subunit
MQAQTRTLPWAILRWLKFLPLGLLILPAGCGGDGEGNLFAPNAFVDIAFDIQDPRFNRLSIPNESVIFEPGVGLCNNNNCGLRGVIVYNGPNGLRAYERACPSDPRRDCATLSLSPGGAFLYCGEITSSGREIPCTGSRFQLPEGLPIEGPAQSRVAEYSVRRQGNLIFISNSD